eukprot:scaffold144513_cov14-Tisochrysis_lutea.AAC.1
MMRENGAGMDETPGSWVELLEALCLGFDRTMLLQSMDSSHALCRRISESLQVCGSSVWASAQSFSHRVESMK